MDSSVAVALISTGGAIGGMIVKFFLDKKEVQVAKKPKVYPKFSEHTIFTRFQSLKDSIQMSFELKNKGKELVFKDLLQNNINVWDNTLKELAQKLDNLPNTEDTIGLYNLIMEYFEKGMRDFNNYYKNPSYTDDEQRVLTIVISKFNKWNFPRINSFRETFKNVCDSKFYNGTKVKSAFTMDVFMTLFIDTLNDAQSTLNELNGDLKGLQFKGVTI